MPGLMVLSDQAASLAVLDPMEPWPAEQILVGFESHENREVYAGNLALGIYAARPGQLSIDSAYPVDEVIKIISGELVLRESEGQALKRFGPGEWLYVGRGFVGIWELQGDFRELHILAGEDAPEGLGDGLPELEGQEPDQVGLLAVAALDPSRINEGTASVLTGRKIVVRQLQLGAGKSVPMPRHEQVIAVQSGQIQAGGATYGEGDTLVLTEEFEGQLVCAADSTLLEISIAGSAEAERSWRERTRALVTSASAGAGRRASNWAASMCLAR